MAPVVLGAQHARARARTHTHTLTCVGVCEQSALMKLCNT